MGLQCEKCERPTRDRTHRFCLGCYRRVRTEMRESGYLQDTYVPPYLGGGACRRRTIRIEEDPEWDE